MAESTEPGTDMDLISHLPDSTLLNLSTLKDG